MSDENDGEDGSTASGEESSEREGGDESGEKGDDSGDDQAAETTSKGSSEPSGPQQLLDAVGEQIDEVRRRVDDQDTSQPEDETLIEEGEADEDEPVDDTIAPPG